MPSVVGSSSCAPLARGRPSSCDAFRPGSCADGVAAAVRRRRTRRDRSRPERAVPRPRRRSQVCFTRRGLAGGDPQALARWTPSWPYPQLQSFYFSPPRCSSTWRPETDLASAIGQINDILEHERTAFAGGAGRFERWPPPSCACAAAGSGGAVSDARRAPKRRHLTPGAIRVRTV